MHELYERVLLESMGPDEAAVAMCSLPLPPEGPPDLGVAFPGSALQPVGWWRRHEAPRRALAFAVGSPPLPATLRLARMAGPAAPPAPRWSVVARVSREQLGYVAHKFSNVDALRGVPARECTTVEFELLLEFGGKTVALQAGATGPRGGPYFWQNVQVDRLWHNAAVEAVRAGGVVYNEDTYLWCDIYFLLFSNGVGHAAAHFVNTKLHIAGYDFQGLPMLRLAGRDLRPRDAELPRDGLRFDLGLLRLNLSDAADLCSDAQPGRLRKEGDDLHWYPVSRVFNPQVPDSPPLQWEAGFARTLRFQFSLADAPAAVARYRVPAWWYARCGEPWPGGYLPVQGRYARMAEVVSDAVCRDMIRGRFDAGRNTDKCGNDGHTAIGLLETFYQTGRPELLTDGLHSCYYWADLAVDHRDFTIHQWIGGWPWKTCAYTKFRDLLLGYMETGDPYLLDTAENGAEAYWVWFRSNWPRCAIGRDAFEIGGWALLWRFLRTEHARERSRELVRMLRTVLDARGVVGGQMGAGPHPGYLSALYMTGVCMTSLLEVAEAAVEEGGMTEEERAGFAGALSRLHDRFMRDDVGLFPSDFEGFRATWSPAYRATWAMLGMRIYPEMIRLLGIDDRETLRGLRSVYENAALPPDEWAVTGRLGHHFISPPYHDALLLGARVVDGGIEIAPVGEPDLWPERQTVRTPYGDLAIECRVEKGTIHWQFRAATPFPVTILHRGARTRTGSQDALRVPAAGGETGVDISKQGIVTTARRD